MIIGKFATELVLIQPRTTPLTHKDKQFHFQNEIQKLARNNYKL